MENYRPPAIAGSFYPADKNELNNLVAKLVNNLPHKFSQKPVALIVPHAGLVFSGGLAGKVYAGLAEFSAQIINVFILAPAHTLALEGVAVPSVDSFATPIGNVEINKNTIKTLQKNHPIIKVNDLAHRDEHSIEIHLPFLQNILPRFSLIPMVVGYSSTTAIASIINDITQIPESILIISSDLSHFHNYTNAVNIDKNTITNIQQKQTNITGDMACGAFPINGLLEFAQKHNLGIELIGYCNSGDIKPYGDKARVVGYGAFALYPAQEQINKTNINDNFGKTLLNIARASITARLKSIDININIDNSFMARLQEKSAVFITLTINGNLRGCIGSLEAHRPLVDDIRENAISAAFYDPRFPQLTLPELDKIKIEVSILTPATSLTFSDENDVLQKLRPHIDGVIFAEKNHRATFLPQVWEQLPQPSEFIAHLKAKAGLPVNYWSADVRVWVYQVEKYWE